MRKKKKIILYVLKGLALLVSISFLVYASMLWLKSDFWRVKKISCQLNGQDCSLELKAALMGSLQGANIISLSSDEVINKIRKTQFALGKIEIEKHLPDELVFQLEKRKPQAAITVESADKSEFYLIDQEGILLEQTTVVSDLPLIFVDQLPAVTVGDKVSQPGIEKIVFLLVDLQLRLLEPSFAKIVAKEEIEIWLKGNIQSRFSLKKDLKPQLDSLQLILTRAKIGGEIPNQIDLRFDKPVITYE